MCEYLDFKELNLHDCKVYAWGIHTESHKLLMDVDWIGSYKMEHIVYIYPHALLYFPMYGM